MNEWRMSHLWAISQKYPPFLFWMCGNPTKCLPFRWQVLNLVTDLVVEYPAAVPNNQDGDKGFTPKRCHFSRVYTERTAMYIFTVLKNPNEGLHVRSRYSLLSGIWMSTFRYTQQEIFIVWLPNSYDTGVDSTTNRNEYQEHFLGVKAAGA